MTNNHCIETQAQCDAARFRFYDDIGRMTPITSLIRAAGAEIWQLPFEWVER